MISAEKDRDSGSSRGRNSTVQSQSFSSSQYGSKSSLRFDPMVLVSGSRNSASKLAIHRRYTEHPLLGVPYGSLQGGTVRPVPCNYYVIQPAFTAVTRVQIPSGTPNLFNNLEEQRRFFAGTKRNSRTARSVRPAVPQPHFPRFVGFFVGTKRHKLTPQL